MRKQSAAEVAALVKGFREKKPNLARMVRQLAGEDHEGADLEDLRGMLEESNARVDPEARRKQLEMKKSLEKNREN